MTDWTGEEDETLASTRWHNRAAECAALADRMHNSEVKALMLHCMKNYQRLAYAAEAREHGWPTMVAR